MSPAAPARISVQLVRHVADWMATHQVPVEPVLRAAGIDPAVLDDPEGMVPLSGYVATFEAAADATRTPYLGLKLGQFTDVDTMGALGHLFMSAPSLLDACGGLASHLDALQEATQCRVVVSGETVQFQYRIDDDGIRQRRQDAEFSISATRNMVHLYSAGRVRPKEVHFEHRQAGRYAAYLEHFRCGVFFEQPINALVFERASFSAPQPHRGSVLYPILSSHLDALVRERSDGPGVAGTVGRLIEQQLADGGVSQAEAARLLGVSASTLGRRLREEGLTFRRLLSARRLAAAQRLLLVDETPVADVALAVGYAENASFSRAFRAAFGQSPEQFRKAHRRSPAL